MHPRPSISENPRLTCASLFLPPLLILALAGSLIVWRSLDLRFESEITHQSEALADSITTEAQTATPEELQKLIESLAHTPRVEVILVAAGQPQSVVAASRAEWIGLPLSQIPDVELARNVIGAAKSTNAQCAFTQLRESFNYSAPVELQPATQLDTAKLDAALAFRLATKSDADAVAASSWQAAGILVALAVFLTTLASIYLPSTPYSSLFNLQPPRRRKSSVLSDPERELAHMTEVLADMASQIPLSSDRPGASSGSETKKS
jgi:hypothetical protein